jgi:hypothetical protein
VLLTHALQLLERLFAERRCPGLHLVHRDVVLQERVVREQQVDVVARLGLEQMRTPRSWSVLMYARCASVCFSTSERGF